MDYNRIFDKIDEMVKNEYPKNYKVKVIFNQEKTFNGFTELTIELVDEDCNKVVYHKYLKEINSEIQKIGFSKYITNLKFFLGKIIKKIFSRGDIFWGNNEIANGSEQKGYRPFLIISNNMNNKYSPLLTVVPLTTQHKKDLPTHKTVKINDVECTALCEQITCVQKTDLTKYIRSLTKDEFKNIEDGIKIQLALNTKNVKNLQKNEEKTHKKGVFTKFFEKIKYLFKKEKKNEGRN